MININVEPDIFNEAYLPYLESTQRTQIFYGGSSSGKSVFLSQRCVYDLLNGGRNYLVCRAVGKTIRRSVFNEIRKVIADWNLNNLFTVNKVDGIITCANGYQILFVGLDDVQKVKSITPEKGSITDIWVEEATETERATITELYKRQRGGDESVHKRLTLSFNPILQSHWIFERWFKDLGWTEKQTEHIADDLLILKTWYKHNRFLTPDDVRDLENEPDKYYFNVYTLGNWGVLGHVIFSNYVIADLNDEDDPYYLPDEQRTNRRNGLDFGFSSDPAALSVSHYDRSKKIVYFYDELYETGLTNDVLAGEVKKIIADDYVFCDSAEPKSIAELKQHGVNARPARKGKDSVIFGIQWLQQQTLVFDKCCINAINEVRQYQWKEDKYGNAMRQPVDKNNHFIDATRYAYEDEALRREAIAVQHRW